MTYRPKQVPPIRGEEVNTMNTILESVEQILGGIELEDVDMPVYDLADSLHQRDGQGTGGGGC
jgi:hypothetical protein